MSSGFFVGKKVRINKQGSEFNGQVGKIVAIKSPTSNGNRPRYSVSFDDDYLTFVFLESELLDEASAKAPVKNKR